MAARKPVGPHALTVAEAAKQVNAGKFGEGPDISTNLSKAGYAASEVLREAERLAEKPAAQTAAK